MKRYISLLLSFILIFSLFAPTIQAVSLDDSSLINEGDSYLEEPFDDCILTSQNVVGVIPENVESLKNAILYIINNPEKSKEFGENAKSLALEKFDRKTSYLEIIKTIEEVAKY